MPSIFGMFVETLLTETDQMKKLLSLLAFAFLSGCASVYNPVPDGYVGPTSNLSDSFNVVSGSKVEFFYVDQLDGHQVTNSRFASIAANKGRGMSMSPVFIQRAIPANKPLSLLLVARTEYAAPILTLTNAVYQVKGTIDFTPEPNKRYIVRGELGESRSSVWLEEKDSKQLVGKKIELEGSAAKLGFLEK
ncbi:MAG: hypothetical protein C0487_04315 [Leptothrix sp. (in: Bacteria)]|nr:hypothetical protein [Leptothrix sp. (in: b-proteobacteria)]